MSARATLNPKTRTATCKRGHRLTAQGTQLGRFGRLECLACHARNSGRRARKWVIREDGVVVDRRKKSS